MRTTIFIKSFDLASQLLEKGYTLTAIKKDEYKMGRHIIHFKNAEGLEELVNEWKVESTRLWKEKQKEFGN